MHTILSYKCTLWRKIKQIVILKFTILYINLNISKLSPFLRYIAHLNITLRSSFTATREMMEIMQEHGEVVVCTGSNLNIENVDLFLQADCR